MISFSSYETRVPCRTLFHDTKSTKAPFTPVGVDTMAHFQVPESNEYEAGLTVIGEFDTVETFCRYFNWLKPPSKLERNSNYHLFKSGIKPMWEDDANANGGKWVLTMKNNPQLLDRCWTWLAMALVGEDLDEGDEICGAVVSLRSKVDRIQLWTRSKDDVEKINGIGRKMVKLLDVSDADGIGLEFQVCVSLSSLPPTPSLTIYFQFNSDDRPQPNKYLTIQTQPQSSFRSTFAHSKNTPTASNTSTTTASALSNTSIDGAGLASSGSGGAFAHFGVGGGGALGSTAGGAWRGKKT
jgi:translation initiation factor 4E